MELPGKLESDFNPAMFALDALTAGVTMLDAKGQVVAINEAFGEFMRQNALGGERHGFGEVYLQLYGGLVAPDDITIVANGIQRLLAGKQGPFRFQFPVNASRGQLWIKLAAVRVGMPQTPFIIITHEEITAHRQAQEALLEATARLFHAEDDERRRIARDLHDSTAQYLAGAKLILSQIRVHPGSEAAKDQVEELLMQSLHEIRALTYVLHPPALEDFGLAGALRHFAEGFAKRSGLALSLEIATDFPRLRNTTELALYRVAQEALANVQRHSGSQRVTLGLRLVDDMVLLTIRDYGSGLPEAASQRSDGVGLPGMRIRLEFLNGRLQLNDAKPGLRVEAWAPIAERQVTSSAV